LSFSLADYYTPHNPPCRLLHTHNPPCRLLHTTQSTLQITTHHTIHLADYYTPHNSSCRLLRTAQSTLQITTHHTFIADYSPANPRLVFAPAALPDRGAAPAATVLPRRARWSWQGWCVRHRPCVVGAGSCGEGCGGLRSILVARVCHCSPPLPARPWLAWRQDAAPLGPARLGWKEDGQLEPARRSIWLTAGESGSNVEVVLRLPDGGGVFGVDELSNVGDTLFLHRHSRQALAREAGDLLEPASARPFGWLAVAVSRPTALPWVWCMRGRNEMCRRPPSRCEILHRGHDSAGGRPSSASLAGMSLLECGSTEEIVAHGCGRRLAHPPVAAGGAGGGRRVDHALCIACRQSGLASE